MLSSYLLTALRAFRRQKQHVLLNVLGLSIGIAATIIIALFVRYEMTFDAELPNAEQVYRVHKLWRNTGFDGPSTNYYAAKQLKTLSEVDDIFILNAAFSMSGEFQHGDEFVVLDGIMEATKNIRDFLPLAVIAGDLNDALQLPNKLALSRSEALRIFGRVDAIGQTLVRGEQVLTLAAVYDDVSEHSHFKLKGVVAVTESEPVYGRSSSYSYIRVVPNTDLAALTKKVQATYMATGYSDIPDFFKLSLVPLLDIHLTSHSAHEFKTNGSLLAVKICVGLCVILVLLGSFNFINLSMAQAVKRAKEVGVRKALGASRAQVAMQFLFESVLVALLALVIALALVEVALPTFNALFVRQLSFEYGSLFALMCLLATILVGLIAGIYPALFISAFSAKRVLSGDFQRGKTAGLVRKTLLVLQAALSVAMIVTTLMLSKQLAYLYAMPVGYDKAARIEVQGFSKELLFSKDSEQLLTRLAQIDDVAHVGLLDTSLTGSTKTSMPISSHNGTLSETSLPFIGVGFDAATNLGLELIAGRDFSRQFGSDWYAQLDDNKARASILITESMLQSAGFANPTDALNQSWYFNLDDSQQLELTIVGVVRDVKVGSVHNTNNQMFFVCGYSWVHGPRLVVGLDSNAPSTTIQAIKAELKNWGIHNPEIQFIEQTYQGLYQTDANVAKLVSLFSALTLVLSGLGIYGLSAYSVVRRQKELAIRKVLGATPIGLIGMIAKEYLALIAMSALLAFPFSYWLVETWLNNFNARIDQSVWMYITGLAVVAGITWLTVASITYAAAKARPSGVLRYE
jgi:putative ABC transport system permease protein